jgi:hypothetical protein
MVVQDDRLMFFLFRQRACTELACAILHKADRSNPGSPLLTISCYSTPSFPARVGRQWRTDDANAVMQSLSHSRHVPSNRANSISRRGKSRYVLASGYDFFASRRSRESRYVPSYPSENTVTALTATAPPPYAPRYRRNCESI